ncbi:MAG: polysaccharide biosynthesis tyrosine autokinase [Planctomycetia bacterium]|nr:polysaccharide biosynthesis tyrosine autokinase [Planctomycetia bacterium]
MIPQHDATQPEYPRPYEPARHDAIRPVAAQPPALSSAPDVMTFLDGLRRRWIMATLLGGTLGAIAAIAVYYLLAPYATAYTKLSVAYLEPKMWATPSAANDFKSVLTTTAAEINNKVVFNAALKNEAVKKLGLEKRESDPVQMIEDGLKVEYKENSELLTILFSHSDPQVALAVANAVRDAYFDTIVRQRQNARTNKVTELEKLYGDTVESLKNKKESLARIAQAAGFPDMSQWQIERTELNLRLRDERQKLTTVQLKVEEAKAALETFDASYKAWKERKEDKTSKTDAPKNDISAVVDSAMDSDARAKQIRDRLEARERLVAEYVRRGSDPRDYRKYNEDVATLKSQLDERRTELTDRVKTAIANQEKAEAAKAGTGGSPRVQDPVLVRAHLERQVTNYKTFEEKLRTQIEELSRQAAKVPVLGPDYDRLAAEIKRDEELINDIFRRQEQEKLETRARARVAPFPQGAELMKPDTKKQLLATVAAPFGVLFAVAAGLAWLECGKRRVRKAGEISRGLGIRVVGAVPRHTTTGTAGASLSKQLIGTNGESELEGTPVMESIDAIRAALLHEADSRSTRTVMITSATSGEGKTTLAAALAGSLARAGRKTLLLDGDLRRPTVHELFEVAPQPGFSEVLLNEVELNDAALETPIENLWILPAGQWDREVLLALSRDGLQGVIERMSEEFDFILIDSHPVLEATDALLIGRQVDAVLLSVLSDVSQMPRVYAAQQQMTNLGIRVLGAVVNAASPEEALTSPSAVPVMV